MSSRILSTTPLSWLWNFLSRIYKNRCITRLSQLPQSLCYPYLLSLLSNKVLDTDGIDYVTVFQEEEVFKEFSRLHHPSVERTGYTYEPIEIQGKFSLSFTVNFTDTASTPLNRDMALFQKQMFSCMNLQKSKITVKIDQCTWSWWRIHWCHSIHDFRMDRSKFSLDSQRKTTQH